MINFNIKVTASNNTKASQHIKMTCQEHYKKNNTAAKLIKDIKTQSKLIGQNKRYRKRALNINNS